MARHITTNRRGWGLLWGVFLVNGLLPSPLKLAQLLWGHWGSQKIAKR